MGYDGPGSIVWTGEWAPLSGGYVVQVQFLLGLAGDALLSTLALVAAFDSSVQPWAMSSSNTWDNALLPPCAGRSVETMQVRDGDEGLPVVVGITRSASTARFGRTPHNGIAVARLISLEHKTV